MIPSARSSALISALLLCACASGGQLDESPDDAAAGGRGGSDGAGGIGAGGVGGLGGEATLEYVSRCVEVGTCARLRSWSCPPGWHELPGFLGEPETAPFSACEPPPVPDTCPRGSFPVVGSARCEPLGDPCPEGEWPTLAHEGATLYVAPGGTGDGRSPESAFGSLTQALAAADADTAIFLSKGVHVAPAIRVDSGATIVGACVAETTLRADLSGGGSSAITGTQLGVRIRSLRLESPGGGVFASLSMGGDVRVEGVEIQADYSALSSGGGGSLIADGVYVHPTARGSYAVGIGRASQTRLGRVTIDGAHGRAIEIWGDEGERAHAELEDILVRDVVPADARRPGEGIVMLDTVEASLKRVVIDGAHEAAIRFASTREEFGAPLVAISDLVVRKTKVSRDGGGGLVLHEGSVTGERLLFDENAETALRIGSPTLRLGSSIQLDQLLVRDTIDRRDRGSFALLIEGRSAVSGSQLVFERNEGVAIATAPSASAERPDVSLTNLLVRDTRAIPGRGGGRGLEFAMGTIGISRATVETSREVGLFVRAAEPGWAPVVQADMLTIRNAQGARGRGVQVQGGTLTLSNAVIEESGGYGVLAYGEDPSQPASLSLAGVAITNTRALTCATPGCAAAGTGLAGIEASGIDVERFELLDNEEAGLFLLGEASSLTGAIGRIEGNRFGALAAGQSHIELTDVLIEDPAPVEVFSVPEGLALTPAVPRPWKAPPIP